MAEVSFGEWLQRRRKAVGLTQEQFARQINCSTSALRKIEEGIRRPSKQMVEQFAEAFNIAPNERTAFLQFARGNFKAASPEVVEELPWRTSTASPRSNLPAGTTSFIGREREQREIIDLIANHRLMTLTGMGGIGKTRLAIEIGKRLLADYAHGIWLVELASLRDPVLVPQTVATALGITQHSNRDPTAALIEDLQTKTALLILDNCDHLLDASAELVSTLLKQCPRLKILATSREVLHITGEALYQIPSLTMPKLGQIESLDELKQYESIQLFSERVRLSWTNFSVTMDNANSIVQICQYLDGIPLAIELAATWVRSLSCDEIAQQIEQGIGFLTTSLRDVPKRHRSMQAVLDHSWNLLSGEERAVLRKLSVFHGGFERGAAEQVVGLSLPTLTALLNKSLVRQVALGRFDMHELLRQYVHEKLLESGETDEIQSRHLEFFLKLAAQAEPKLRGTEQAAWLERLEQEHDNLRAALQWSLQQEDAEMGLQLAGHLWWFWFLRGYWSEGRKWLTTRIGTRAIALQTQTLSGAGWLALYQGDYKWVTMFSEEILAQSGALGDKGSVATLLDNLGMAAQMEGDDKKAMMLFADALALRRKVGDKAPIAQSLLNLGGLYILQGRYAQAQRLLQESLALDRELDDQWNVTYSLMMLGYLSLFKSQIGEALAIFRDSLAKFQGFGDKLGIIYSLLGLAMGAATQENPVRAANLFGVAEILRETTGFQLPPGQRRIYEKFVSSVRVQLDPSAFETAWQAGRLMTLNEAMEFALQDKQK